MDTHSLISLALPKDYGYVVLTVVSTFFVGMWHGIRIGPFRNAARITHPQAMAEQSQILAADRDAKKKMYLNNCAQRAHANYLENQGSVIAAMLIAGLRYPVVTTAMGTCWVAGRIFYALGYTRADKEFGNGRFPGLWLSAVFQVALFGLAGWVGLEMIA